MSRQANVNSVDALHRFRAAVCEYADTIQDILAQLQVESDRTIEWVQHDRMAYWPNQARIARDRVSQALNTLHIKQLTIDGGPKPACVEERDVVEQAKRRLHYSEQQVQAIRQLLPTLQHENDEYQGVLGKLSQLLDTDLPAAIAALDRMIAALGRYTAPQSPPSSVESLRSRPRNLLDRAHDRTQDRTQEPTRGDAADGEPAPSEDHPT